MFPERPRRPIIERPVHQTKQPSRNQQITKVLDLFKDKDGDLDLDKIMNTTHQLNKIYHDIRPLMEPFKKK